MPTLKLAAPAAALLAAWLVTATSCLSALATVPATLTAIGAHPRVTVAPAVMVSVAEARTSRTEP